MVFMVPEWIYRELPWFSWSKSGSIENYHGFHGPKVDLSDSCTVSKGLQGPIGASLSFPVDRGARPPGQIFI